MVSRFHLVAMELKLECKTNGKDEAVDVSFQKVTIVGAMSLVPNRIAICLAVV